MIDTQYKYILGYDHEITNRQLFMNKKTINYESMNKKTIDHQTNIQCMKALQGFFYVFFFKCL